MAQTKEGSMDINVPNGADPLIAAIDGQTNEDGYAPLGETSSERGYFRRTFGEVKPGSVRGSIFTLASTAIGAGVLALPYVMKTCGLGLGLILLISSGLISLFSIQLLVWCGRETGIKQYSQLVEHVFGKGWSKTFEVLMVVYCFGVCIGYFVIIGDVVPGILSALGLGQLSNRTWDLIVLCCCIAAPLATLRNFSSLRYSSIIGLAFILYLTTVVVGELPRNFNANKQVPIEWFRFNFGVFSSISITFFAFTCHVNVFSVYSELVNPLERRIQKVTYRTVLAEVTLYLLVSVAGYLSFRGLTSDNITTNFANDDWFMNVAKLGVCFTLMCNIPLNVHPARLNLNSILFKTQNVNLAVHLATTFTLVLLALLLAIFIPEIKTIFSLLGACCSSVVSFVFPGALYLKLSGQPLSAPFNVAVLLMVIVCSAVGAFSVYDIVSKF